MPDMPIASTLELALCDHIDQLDGLTAVTRTDEDLNDLVAELGPVVRLHRTGGRDAGWQQILRIGIEVWGPRDGYTATWDAAEAVHAHLVRPGSFYVSGWLIDRVTSESALTEMRHDSLRLIQAAVRVTTRTDDPA